MRQLDLFACDGLPPSPAETQLAEPPVPVPPPEALSDAALLAAIPAAGRANCHGLAEEVVRRRLPGAVAALEELCRRFKGFGLERAVPEQTAALGALAAIGGAEAAAAVRRIMADGVVAEPGLPQAMHAAATLRCILPEATALVMLQHTEPWVRSQACGCAPRTAATTAMLVSLLDDLNPGVAGAAAIALGQRGRPEARIPLLRLLQQEPTAAVIDALAGVADEETTVLIGRIGRQRPDLRQPAVAALEAIDSARAALLLKAITHPDESHPAG